MNDLICVLLVEDNADDALLVERELRAGGLAVRTRRVDSEATLREALAAERWDLILCDFDLPGFTGADALKIVREHDGDVPFIFVSGTMGEAYAVEAMRAGAHDYVLKQYLPRLLPAVERELRDARVRRAARTAESALHASQLRFQQVFDSNVVGIAFWDAAYRIVDANDAFLDMVGYSRQELDDGSLDWERATPDEFSGADQAAITSIEKSGQCPPYRKEFQHRSGRRVSVLMSAGRVEGSAFAGVGIAVDISGERRAERQRSEAEALVAAMVESTPLPMIVLDAAGCVQLWNPAAEAVFGWSSEACVGRALPWIATDRNGQPLDLPALEALGPSYHIGETFTTNSRGEQLVVELHLSPTRDADGKPNGTALVARDLTESRRMESQLRQSQKMQVVGNLASGIAHDFNNLLAAITLSIELALDEIGDQAPVSADLQTARDAAYRGAGLTNQLLGFSRPGAGTRAAVDLSAVLHDVAQMLARLLGNPDISLAITKPPTSVTIVADRGNIEQILLNLAINARDAMPAGGALTLALRTRDVDGKMFAEISVSDTGVGIPTEMTDRVFEPFFTTKEPGRGTGLGLSMVRDLVLKNGGSIELRSVVGLGTTFVLRFPLADAAGLEPAAEPPSVASPSARVSVLLVDDDPLIRRILERIIRRLGHAVATASNGHEAATIFAASDPRPRLVVTDIEMPGMRGEELAVQLRRVQPQLPVLFVSGANGSDELQDFLKTGSAELLAKPFREQDLVDAINRLLRTPL